MKIMTVFFFLFVVLILFLGYTYLTRDSHGIDGARLDSVIYELNKISSLIRPFDDKSNLTPKSEQNTLIQGNFVNKFLNNYSETIDNYNKSLSGNPNDKNGKNSGNRALLSHPSTDSQKRVPLQERLPYDISQFTTKFTQADKNFILELDNEISRYIFTFSAIKKSIDSENPGNFEFYLPASNKDFIRDRNNINSFDVSPQVKPIRDTWIESVNDMEYEFTLLKTNKSIILTAPLSDTRKEMYYQNIQEILNTLDTWSKISGSIKNNKLYL